MVGVIIMIINHQVCIIIHFLGFEQYCEWGDWRIESTYLQLRSCLAPGLEYGGMGISISCKYLSNEPTSVFFPEINHSPARLTFNHLPFPLVEAVGDISTSMPRFINDNSDVRRKSTLYILPTQNPTKMAAIFQNWRRLGSVRIGCTFSPGPRLALYPRKRGTGFEVSADLGPSHRLRVESGAIVELKSRSAKQTKR